MAWIDSDEPSHVSHPGPAYNPNPPSAYAEVPGWQRYSLARDILLKLIEAQGRYNARDYHDRNKIGFDASRAYEAVTLADALLEALSLPTAREEASKRLSKKKPKEG